MITKIRIRGYRIYIDFLLKPNPGVNILVGDNDAGKPTLMEAISLALNLLRDTDALSATQSKVLMYSYFPDWFFSIRQAGGVE